MNEVVITSDSSPSVYSSQFDALYHSKHGAIQESMHVFLKSGLSAFRNSLAEPKQSIAILEIGFGTGLNSYLTLKYAQKHELTMRYTGLEAYPLSDSVLSSYLKHFNQDEDFKIIHNCAWEKNNPLSSHFDLTKKKVLFQDFDTKNTFDIIYFDAFAPNTQPELWEVEMMKKMYEFSHIGTLLVTYCAKGQVRRNLIEAGFEVERIPGPPGKREMLRGIRTS